MEATKIKSSTLNKVMKDALEICEDYLPLRRFNDKRIGLAWFNEKQLKTLIKHCIAVGKGLEE